MSKSFNHNNAYGVGAGPIVNIFPAPIVAKRNPGTKDFADIGQTWVNTVTNSPFILTSIGGNVATWVTTPAAGAGVFTDLTATGTITLDSAVASLYQVTGAGADLTVQSTAGSVIVSGGEAVANALQLAAPAGGITVSAAGDIAFDTPGAILFVSGTDTGFTVNGADLNLGSDGGAVNILSQNNDNAEAILIQADGGTAETILIQSVQGTGADSIELEATEGGITLNADEAVTVDSNRFIVAVQEDLAGVVSITSDGGTAETIVITNTQGTDAGAITLNALAGGIDLNSAAGFTLDTINALSLDATAASNFTVTGAGEDLTLNSVLGSVKISSTESAVAAVSLIANGGVAETIFVNSVQGTSAGAITLTSTAGGIDVNAGSLVTIDAVTSISLDSLTASNFTVTGAGQDLTLSSAGGSVKISSTENAVGAVEITSNAGVAETIVVTNTQGTSAGAITLTATAGSIDINSAGGLTIDTVTALSLDATAASNFTVTGGGLDLTLNSVGGSVAISSTENVPSAVSVLANGGTGETVLIRAAQGTLVNSVDIVSTAGGVRVTTGAVATATGLHLVQGANTVGIYVGSGAPAFTAVKGSLYLAIDGTTTNDRAYIATDGAGTWTAIITAA